MANILAGHTPTLLREPFDVPTKSPFDHRILCFLRHESHSFVRVPVSSRRNRLCFRPVCAANSENLDEGDGNLEDGLDRIGPVNSDKLREDLEKIVGCDDSSFSGVDLATLIRKKYGRSYDVQLIKKEFMGRNLLAMNVMWKYREQRSFPLSEEEYILRLDDVANMLKCWGAVSHVRNSLEKVKERPRIGKAVSIFIDMDEKGGRANEWIYK